MNSVAPASLKVSILVHLAKLGKFKKQKASTQTLKATAVD